jgi:hypothetical protein
VETQLREKPLQGSQTQEFHYLEDKARYKIVTLTCTDAVVIPCSLTCNPTLTLPNQVSYLKGSSMEFLTLEPTSKIDFSCSPAHFPELLWNSILNSYSSQCPGASIYSLRCRMGDCCNMYGRRPDGELGSSGRTTVRQDFLKISLKIFPV